MNKYNAKKPSIDIPEPNFEWHIGDDSGDMVFCFIVNKIWYNRFKWWVATKLFLPGWYKWTDKERVSE